MTPQRSSTNTTLFLSTPSARRATKTTAPAGGWNVDFYPRPPRGGRQNTETKQANVGGISIHALREEGDNVNLTQKQVDELFLSTPSARRATQEIYAQGNAKDISIHALREEGDFRIYRWCR